MTELVALSPLRKTILIVGLVISSIATVLGLLQASSVTRDANAPFYVIQLVPIILFVFAAYFIAVAVLAWFWNVMWARILLLFFVVCGALLILLVLVPIFMLSISPV